jgi:hypothetical protein
MIERKLYRIAYVDSNLLKDENGNPTQLAEDSIIEAKQPYQFGTKDQEEKRNSHRGKMKSVIMVEKEVDTSDQPFIVSGCGINISSHDRPDYRRYIENGKLKSECATQDLKAIYLNMMYAALNNGAKAFICPFLSSGYYAGKQQLLSEGIRLCSKSAYNQALDEFNATSSHGLKIFFETENSINKFKELIKEGYFPSQIAIGIAGADNSGTGSIFTEDTQKKIANGVRLPQEESVRWSLAGAFIVESNYSTIDEIQNSYDIYLKKMKALIDDDDFLKGKNVHINSGKVGQFFMSVIYSDRPTIIKKIDAILIDNTKESHEKFNKIVAEVTRILAKIENGERTHNSNPETVLFMEAAQNLNEFNKYYGEKQSSDLSNQMVANNVSSSGK